MKVSILVDEKNIKKGKENALLKDAIKYLYLNNKDNERVKNKFYKYLKTQSKKHTEEREIIINAILSNNKKTFTETDIHIESLRTHYISKKTVYNTFKILIKAGIIKETDNNSSIPTKYYQLL